MIQIRKMDGTVIPIPEEGRFVELVNDIDGTVMMSFLQVRPGAILHIKPGTADASRYEQMFATKGVKFSPSMIVRESR
jgi:hypothetical protein